MTSPALAAELGLTVEASAYTLRAPYVFGPLLHGDCCDDVVVRDGRREHCLAGAVVEAETMWGLRLLCAEHAGPLWSSP